MLASEPVSRLSTQMTRWSFAEQRLTEVRAEEAGAAGNDRGWHRRHPIRAGGSASLHNPNSAAHRARRSVLAVGSAT